MEKATPADDRDSSGLDERTAISTQYMNAKITKAMVLKHGKPVFGATHPQRMENPFWLYMAQTGKGPFTIRQQFNIGIYDFAPIWCFIRMGMTTTELPDGRTVCIGGEHEDCYDPDFCIYNDVVVKHPNGRLDIFGYPREIFPPTDFHSATLVSNRIVLVGCLGYSEDRRPDRTPVMVLDLNTFAFTKAKTSGTPPGWIHGHKATLSEDGGSILMQGGKLDPGGDVSLTENIDDWRLHLADWRWERLTERRWPRWEVRRKDGEMNHLLDYEQAFMVKNMPALEKQVARLTKPFEIPSLKEQLGGPPDLELFARRYQPSVAHQQVSQPSWVYGVHRIKVEGVVVRYVEDMGSVQMTVEGSLPQSILEALTADLLDKFSKLERTACELIPLGADNPASKPKRAER